MGSLHLLLLREDDPFSDIVFCLVWLRFLAGLVASVGCKWHCDDLVGDRMFTNEKVRCGWSHKCPLREKTNAHSHRRPKKSRPSAGPQYAEMKMERRQSRHPNTLHFRCVFTLTSVGEEERQLVLSGGEMKQWKGS